MNEIHIEKLSGLPGTGVSPRHFYYGKATPWTEGIVYQIDLPSGETWIGNFQPGQCQFCNITFIWQEASRIIIIADGACYIISIDNPDDFICIQTSAMSHLFDEENQKLFVADFWDLVAYNRFCKVIWHREALGVDGIKLAKIQKGIIEGKLCWDPPDNWIEFKISSRTGEDVS